VALATLSVVSASIAQCKTGVGSLAWDSGSGYEACDQLKLCVHKCGDCKAQIKFEVPTGKLADIHTKVCSITKLVPELEDPNKYVKKCKSLGNEAKKAVNATKELEGELKKLFLHEYDSLLSFKRFCERKKLSGEFDKEGDLKAAFKQWWSNIDTTLSSNDEDQKIAGYKQEIERLKEEEKNIEILIVENKKAEAIIKEGIKHKVFSGKDKKMLYKNPKKLIKKTQIEERQDKNNLFKIKIVLFQSWIK